MKKLRQEFADTMLEIGETDESLVVMVGDISHGILKPFAEKHPDRYYNIGICEPAMVNLAAGLSKVGLTPVVHTIAPFIIERAYEQIKLDFGYQKLPINLISVGGAFDYAQLGCSHHCYTDVSLISHIKDSCVFCPGSAEEFNTLFKQSYNNGKINYFRLTENPHGIEHDQSIKVGEGVVVAEGSDLTIVTTGAQLKKCYAATEVLKAENIAVELIYLPTLHPFPKEQIHKSLSKTKRLLTVEELSSHCGIYSSSLEASLGINIEKAIQIAIDDFIYGYGTYEEVCERNGFTELNIIKKAMELKGV